MGRRSRITLGVLLGLLWGAGLSVLLQHYGVAHFSLPLLIGVPLAAAALSGLWVAFRTRRHRGGVATAILGGLLLALLGGGTAHGQQEPCFVVVNIDGVDTELTGTSPGNPLVVSRGSGGRAEFWAFAPFEFGSAPFDIWVDIGGARLPINSSTASGAEAHGGFNIDNELGILGDAIGLFHVGGSIEGVCTGDGYVRIEGNPLTTPTGLGAAGALLVGLVGTVLVGRPPPRPPQPVTPEEPPTEEPTSEDLEPEDTLEHEPVPGVRTPYVQTELFDAVSGGLVASTMPVVSGHPYDFRVTVMPSEPSEQPDSDHDIVVAATSDGMGEVPTATMTLPASGAPVSTNLRLTPTADTGKVVIDLDLLGNGHLLQSQRISVDVVPTASEAIPRAAARAEDTAFTASSFDPAELEALTARAVTLVLRHDPTDDSVDCIIFDWGDTAAPVRIDTSNPKEEILSASARVRERLQQMIEDGDRGYRTAVEGDAHRLAGWLPSLADIGHSLYLTLLDPGGSPSPHIFPPGAIVQINQVASGLGKATVPWAIMYEREVDFRPGVTTVCEDFKEHPPDECTHAADPTVVCPWGFWGYRYVLEQPPGWVGDRGELPPPLTRLVENGKPLVMSFGVFEGFELWDRHVETLHASGDMDIQSAGTTEELKTLWSRLGDRVDLVYFYVHAGSGGARPDHWLQLTDAPISRNNLRAWRHQLQLAWPHHPLVVLNGCGTGSYGPDAYTSIINEFREFGAGGVIGTECPVSEVIADAFTADVLARFARGGRLGEQMLEVRRRFLLEWDNPSALVYSLYAPSDLVLAQPVA